MCLTIPLKIISVENKKARVSNCQNKIYEVDISLVGNIKKGDWVLVNTNMALKKIGAKEAKEILNYFKH